MSLGAQACSVDDTRAQGAPRLASSSNLRCWPRLIALPLQIGGAGGSVGGTQSCQAACAARVIPLRRQPRNTHRQTWCAPVPSIPSSIFSCAISARTRTSSSLCHETHGPISWRPLMASRGGRNILNDVPTLSISSAAPCRALGVLVSWCMGRYPCSRVPIPGHLSEVLAHCRHTRLPALPRRLGLGGVLASPSLRGSASSKARAPLRACPRRAPAVARWQPARELSAVV